MFLPNAKCLVAKKIARNVHAEDVLGTPVEERCAVLELKSSATLTNSRAQLSGSQEHAEDLTIIGRLMLTANTNVLLGDQITVARTVMRAVSLEPQFNTAGVLDHFVCGGAPWA